MKKVGILYDNISGNTGDVAIGLSLKKILNEINVDYDELIPGNFNASNYEMIIIGGGHIIRPSPDFFYDKFRVYGNHILNAAGILSSPSDLDYLNEYRYVTVRSQGDKKKLSYLKKNVHVVPCTTMLLEDLKDYNINIKDHSIGIHLSPNIFNQEEERLFIEWASMLPFNIYFIPITHYNKDYIYMEKLCSKVKNSVLLPILSPMEIFTTIGRFDYFISCSLHGAIFSYIHNKPFILYNYDEKMQFFMEDRGLNKYLFKHPYEIKDVFEKLVSDKPDYSVSISKDKKILADHIERLREILPIGKASMVFRDNVPKSDNHNQTIYQLNNLQIQVSYLRTQLENAYLKIEEKNKQLFDAYSTIEDTKKSLEHLNIIIEEKNKQLSIFKDIHNSDIISINELKNTISELNNQLQYLKLNNQSLESELTDMKRSIVWQLTMKFEKSLINRLLPIGTKRRKIYDLGLKGGRAIINDGIGQFWKLHKEDNAQKNLYKKSNVYVKKKLILPNLKQKINACDENIKEIKKVVSIIIPTRNAGHDFEFTLEKLRCQKGVLNPEIIIVDSGSTDNTIELAIKYGAKVININPKNFNHGETRNYGAQHASGDYILFMVQDAIPIGQYWLYNMLKLLENDKDVAAVTCRQIPRSDADLIACYTMWNHYRAIGFDRDKITCCSNKNIKDMPMLEQRMIAGLDDVSTCIRRDIFNKLKFKKINFAEDLDLGIRIIDNGFKIGFLYSVGVIHSHNRSAGYYMKRYYVDSKSLSNLFNTKTHLQEQDINVVLYSIISLYDSINYSISKLNDSGNELIRLDTFFSSLKSNICMTTSIQNIVEQNNQKELDMLMSELRQLSCECQSNRNCLIDRYCAILDDFHNYLCNVTNSYGRDELIDSIYKLFSIVCGSSLGDLYYTLYNDERMQYIDNILSKGV